MGKNSVTPWTMPRTVARRSPMEAAGHGAKRRKRQEVKGHPPRGPWALGRLGGENAARTPGPASNARLASGRQLNARVQRARMASCRWPTRLLAAVNVPLAFAVAVLTPGVCPAADEDLAAVQVRGTLRVLVLAEA